MSFRHYTWELYNRPKASLLHPKARMVEVEIVVALLYRCARWTPLEGHYDKFRTSHHRMYPRILGVRCKLPDNRILSYKDALQRTGRESINAFMRTGTLLWAGLLLRMGDRSLPKRAVSEELEKAGKVGPGEEEK